MKTTFSFVVSDGVTWKPRRKRDRSREPSRAIRKLNKRMAASRDYRLAEAKANAMKLLGREYL